VLGNNVHLVLDPNARIIRRFFGNWPQPTITNKDWTNGNSSISVSGGTIASLDSANEGRHLEFVKVDQLKVEGTKILGVYDDWNTLFQNCTNTEISNLFIDSGDDMFEDGLHFSGGGPHNIHDCSITCGDDAIALVNELSADTAMHDVTVSNCYLFSKEANAFKALVGNDLDGPISVYEPISNVKVRNVTAKANGGGIHIADLDAGKRVHDIEVNGFALDASENGGSGFLIEGAQYVTLSNVDVIEPNWACMVDSSDDVTLNNCRVINPRASNQSCLFFGADGGNLSNIHVRGGLMRGAKLYGIWVGQASREVVGWDISDVVIDNAADDGIHLLNASYGLATGNRVTGCVTGNGIAERTYVGGPVPHNNIVIGNYLHGNASNLAIVIGTGSNAANNY
jgi:hypothetical protein